MLSVTTCEKRSLLWLLVVTSMPMILLLASLIYAGTGDMTPWDGVSQGDSRLIAGILGSTDGRVSQAYHRHNGITVRSH